MQFVFLINVEQLNQVEDYIFDNILLTNLIL